MLAIPPLWASSNIALWRANHKPPLEVVVAGIVGDAAPVAVIKPTDYGRMNAAGILRQAEELCGK